MKTLFSLLAVIVAAGVFIFFFLGDRGASKNQGRVLDTVPGEIEKPLIPDISIIVDNLEIPWDVAFLPNGDFLVTERPGSLLRIRPNQERVEIPVDGIRHRGEGGLLGLTLHPRFSENRFLYLYLSAPGGRGETINRVERYRYENDALTDKKIIVDRIPGAIYHDGGRMEFGPDGFLYITTGDATRPDIAQDKNSLGGKILRVRDDGSLPSDNPFGTRVYSYGHRNPQGLAWDQRGNLWGTEHGRSGLLSGLDEINLITKGANYGWPLAEGDETRSEFTAPILHSGPDVTWAPASLAYLNGKLYLGGLRGEALYEAVIEGANIRELNRYFYEEFGRIRTVRAGPDTMLYLTTSNRDDRGTPKANDDKLIRLNPASLGK